MRKALVGRKETLRLRNVMGKQKITAKQRDARMQAAIERERLAEEKKKAAERTKKIFTVAVCVILVLALALPTMAVTLLGGGA